MRKLNWGLYPVQQAQFDGALIIGRSIIVDGASANAADTTEYNGGTFNVGNHLTSGFINKFLGRWLLSSVRSQIGMTPVLVRARLMLHGPTGPTNTHEGWTVGLYRILPASIPDWADVNYRYRDVSAVTPWGGDASIYSPVPGIDHHPVPFATLAIPGSAALDPQWFGFDITQELRYRLASNEDLIFMMADVPIKPRSGTAVNFLWDFKGNAAVYPYLEIQYQLPVEFFGCKADGSINLLKLLDNALDLDAGNLDLGAVERGQIGTAVGARVKNLGDRVLPHLEVWDDSAEWSPPVPDSGNAGSGALAYVTLAEFSLAQKYTVRFTSGSAFEIKAERYKDYASDLNPTFGGAGWTGTTGGDFTAPLGGLTIPTAAWSGSPQANDLFVIYVTGNSTDPAWPLDSNQQVEMAEDAAGAPDEATYRPIKGQRTTLTGSVTIDATTKTFNVKHIDTAKWPTSNKVFVANATTIDRGTIDSVTATSVTITFPTASGHVYAAGDKLCTTLPIRNLGKAVWAVTTGAAGASQSNPAYIPLVNAQTMGFTAGSKILVEDVDDPTIHEEATIATAGVNDTRILVTAYLANDYPAGSLVLMGASGEALFWARIHALLATTEELKRVRINART